MDMKCDAVRFLKTRNWDGTDSRFLVIPADKLAERCFEAWDDIDDEGFAGNVLPADLQDRYDETFNRTWECEDRMADMAWNSFVDALRARLGHMDMEQLADWFVQLNDPVTIRQVLYLRDGDLFLDAECTMPY